MKNKIIIGSIVAVFALAALIWIITPKNDNIIANTTNTNSSANTANRTITNTNTAVNRNTSPQNTNTTTNTSNVNAATTVDVTISASSFSPKTLTIAKGTTVVWTNDSGTTAYVAPDDHPTHRKYAGVWDDDGTGRIADGATYTKTFTTAGTYTYHNHLSTSQTGTITVTE